MFMSTLDPAREHHHGGEQHVRCAIDIEGRLVQDAPMRVDLGKKTSTNLLVAGESLLTSWRRTVESWSCSGYTDTDGEPDDADIRVLSEPSTPCDRLDAPPMLPESCLFGIVCPNAPTSVADGAVRPIIGVSAAGHCEEAGPSMSSPGMLNGC